MTPIRTFAPRVMKTITGSQSCWLWDQRYTISVEKPSDRLPHLFIVPNIWIWIKIRGSGRGLFQKGLCFLHGPETKHIIVTGEISNYIITTINKLQNISSTSVLFFSLSCITRITVHNRTQTDSMWNFLANCVTKQQIRDLLFIDLFIDQSVSG